MHFHEWLSLPCYGNYFIIRPSLQGTGWFAPTNRDQVPLVDNAGWKDEARAYIGYPMSRSNRTAENRRRRRRRGGKGGDRILASEEATGGTLISGRFGRTGNWNKETLGRSIHKLVGAAPLAADRGGGDSCLSLSRFLRQCAWMKVTVKMHAASPVWCGITAFLFAPLASRPCSNFGFGSFSEMTLLISVGAGRAPEPVSPRRLSHHRREWERYPRSSMPGLWS